MRIVGGLDLHRAQITFDYLDTATGEVQVGKVRPGCREAFARFLADLPSSDAHFVVEGCTGWWFVVDELARAGMAAHVADPAEAAALRGRKKRAKTDRADARHLRRLLADDRVPESWIPPAHVMQARALGRLYLDLLGTRSAWAQRAHATLFHHGAPTPAMTSAGPGPRPGRSSSPRICPERTVTPSTSRSARSGGSATSSPWCTAS
jgi:transposase